MHVGSLFINHNKAEAQAGNANDANNSCPSAGASLPPIQLTEHTQKGWCPPDEGSGEVKWGVRWSQEQASCFSPNLAPGWPPGKRRWAPMTGEGCEASQLGPQAHPDPGDLDSRAGRRGI